MCCDCVTFNMSLRQLLYLKKKKTYLSLSHFISSCGFRISTPSIVWVCLRLCVCFVRSREGCTEFGRRRNVFSISTEVMWVKVSDHPLQAHISVCAVFLSKWWPDRLKQLLWLKLPQGQGELSYVWDGMLFMKNLKPYIFHFGKSTVTVVGCNIGTQTSVIWFS